MEVKPRGGYKNVSRWQKIAIEATKVRLTFDSIPYWDEDKIPCNTVLIQGRLMVPVREFASWQNLQIDVDSTTKKVSLYR